MVKKEKTTEKPEPNWKDKNGRFSIGNQFWKMRTSVGRELIFKSPEKLLEACEEYFQWVEDNPLVEEKTFASQGKLLKTGMNKLRAMTLDGLLLFLDIDENTWYEYKKRSGFKEVCTRVSKIIYNQKFTGAAAGLFEHNIIAAELGLKNKDKNTDEEAPPLTINFQVKPAVSDVKITRGKKKEIDKNESDS